VEMSSVDVVNNSFSRRLSLNRQILDNAYWCLPVDSVGHENFMPVGRGSRTSVSCGQWMHFWVCDNVEGHKSVLLKGVDYSGKLVVSHQHMWCGNSRCPVCFIRGWSTRVARAVAGRLEVAVERGFGEIEHLTVSVPPLEYGLTEDVLRERSRMALLVRGVLGGSMIFHGYRKDKCRQVLVWSPHYHCLGFIRGGFDVCRDCVHVREDCASCSGFKGREVREFVKDGYLVKCFEKRKTVVGTVFYQLHHATVRVGLRRFHVVTHFGVCGNSRFKGRKVLAVPVCPACHGEMVKKVFVGKAVIVKDVGSSLYRKVFPFDEFDSDGVPNFVDVGGGRFG